MRTWIGIEGSDAYDELWIGFERQRRCYVDVLFDSVGPDVVNSYDELAEPVHETHLMPVSISQVVSDLHDRQRQAFVGHVLAEVQLQLPSFQSQLNTLKII